MEPFNLKSWNLGHLHPWHLCPMTLQPWNTGEQGSCQGSRKGSFKGSGKNSSPTQIQEGTRRVPAQFQQGFNMFQQASIKVPARFRQDPQGSNNKVPGRFLQGSNNVPEMKRFQFPVWFQGCSGFSGRAFSCHHSPAAEIEPQQIRCWGWFYMIRIKDLQTYSSEKDQWQPHF